MNIIKRNNQQYRLSSGLTAFQTELYIHLIEWKWKHISKEVGIYKKGEQIYEFDAILPKSVQEHFPLIYPKILEDLKQHQQVFDFKLHQHFNHMASSQAANINLFLPILLHSEANKVFQKLKPDFKALAVNELYKGFRIEFWDGNSNQEKGLLGDHSAIAGTDSDIAIAYYNHNDELCLWLIEHKLTEKEFTTCGGSRSKGRKSSHDCSQPFTSILANKDLCYYHSGSGYNYWNITETNKAFFVQHQNHTSCPFKGGLNQLWRNQLLGFALEGEGIYKEVYFSVVHHPDNTSLNESMNEYKKLIADNPKFSVFDLKQVVDVAGGIDEEGLREWVDWYGGLYGV